MAKQNMDATTSQAIFRNKNGRKFLQLRSEINKQRREIEREKELKAIEEANKLYPWKEIE